MKINYFQDDLTNISATIKPLVPLAMYPCVYIGRVLQTHETRLDGTRWLYEDCVDIVIDYFLMLSDEAILMIQSHMNARLHSFLRCGT